EKAEITDDAVLEFTVAAKQLPEAASPEASKLPNNPANLVGQEANVEETRVKRRTDNVRHPRPFKPRIAQVEPPVIRLGGFDRFPVLPPPARRVPPPRVDAGPRESAVEPLPSKLRGRCRRRDP